MYYSLLGVVLGVFSLSAMAADDFQKTLADAGVKSEVIEILVKNELITQDVLCLTTTDELTKIGILLGQAKLIVKFCTPVKPVESADVSKLSELDLLNRLAANPKDGAALQALREKPLVQKATAKTPRWVVVNPDKKLSAEETLKYLTFLNKDTATEQGVSFKGKRTTFIEAALGLESDVWIHPLFEGKFITDGVDEFGTDWSGVRFEVLNALLWSRLTAHKLFPSHLDGAADLAMQQKASIDPLTDPALKKIVDDYKAALEEKEATAMSIDVKKKVTETSAIKSAQSKTSQPQSPPKTYTNSIGMEFVLIPAEKFIMGASFDEVLSSGVASENELPHHEVTVQSFYMSRYEVTQAQWLDVMGNNPSHFNPKVVGSSTKNYPVENVSWNDVREFIKRLNALEKIDKYRLPSEAEWEYAARGGTTTVYWWGDEIGQNNANCNGCGSQWDGKQTAPVGSFKPNPFGLYDTAGNVWEWCQDVWHGNYQGAPTDGRAWVTGGEQSQRVLCGGSWSYLPNGVRSAYRVGINLSARSNNRGFRVVASSL